MLYITYCTNRQYLGNIYTDDCITFSSTRVQECDSDFVAVEEIGTLTARGSNVTQNKHNKKKNDKKLQTFQLYSNEPGTETFGTTG